MATYRVKIERHYDIRPYRYFVTVDEVTDEISPSVDGRAQVTYTLAGAHRWAARRVLKLAAVRLGETVASYEVEG